MVWSIFQYENSFITTTKEKINGVPCLKFKPKGYKDLLPTVIYYHGWHSSKDFKRFEALIIASHGYQVIVPDALYHGDRDAIDHDVQKNYEKYLWEIILESVKESKDFIKTLVNQHEADPERIGIIGSSMGAISAGGVFVDNPYVKCLVGLNGTFAWHESIKRNSLPSTTDDNKKLISQYDPINRIDKIKERAILILHGVDDNSLPIDGQRIFFNKTLPLYTKNPKNLDFIEVANVNHQLTTGMLEKAIMWFKEHL